MMTPSRRIFTTVPISSSVPTLIVGSMYDLLSQISHWDPVGIFFYCPCDEPFVSVCVWIEIKRYLYNQFRFCGRSHEKYMCVHCVTLEIWRQVSQFDCFLWLWFSCLRPFPDVVRWSLCGILWEVSVSAHPSIEHGHSIGMDFFRGCGLGNSSHCDEQDNTQ